MSGFVIAPAKHNDSESERAERQPACSAPEYTTIWSFPVRGSWATHDPGYRGNFAPQIPRNVIEMYSEKGEVVLDPMVGAALTAGDLTGMAIQAISPIEP